MKTTRVFFALGLCVSLGTGTVSAGKAKAGAAKPAAKGGDAAGGKPLAGLTVAKGTPMTDAQIKSARADLDGHDMDKALAAAEALGKTHNTPSAAAANDALLDALSMGVSPKLAMGVLDALAEIKSPQSVDVLAVYARNRNDELRFKAVFALGEVKDAKTTAILLAALRDGGPSVRGAAANALAARRETKAIEPLLALLRRGDEAAANALAELANADLAARLADLIGEVRADLIAKALGGIILRQDFGGKDPKATDEIRLQIVKALGKLPGDAAVPVLTEYVSTVPEKPERPSRTEAAKILEQRQ